jgi:tripartite-type tricarboxylate transporter receptor subunit TctC
MRKAVRFFSRSAFIQVAIACLGTAAAVTARSSDFYRGKQITIIVGNPAGGGFDAYARLLARHMGKYIPGRPSFIVQNMPGAGSVRAAQHLANISAKDGTVFGMVVPGTIMDPLIDGPSKFQYSPLTFEYMGSADSGTRICFTSKTSGVASIADARKAKVIVASTGPQSSSTDYALLMNALAGTQFEIVSGYQGPADLLLAMERGEAAGVCTLDAATVRTVRPDWLRNGQINILAQAGLKPNPEIKAPSMLEFISSNDRSVAEFIFSQQEFHRPFLAPPGTPPEQLAILRSAFNSAMKDSELIAEAEKMGLGVNPKSGEELSAIVARLYASPPELVQRVRKILRP